MKLIKRVCQWSVLLSVLVSSALLSSCAYFKEKAGWDKRGSSAAYRDQQGNSGFPPAYQDYAGRQHYQAREPVAHTKRPSNSVDQGLPNSLIPEGSMLQRYHGQGSAATPAALPASPTETMRSDDQAVDSDN